MSHPKSQNFKVRAYHEIKKMILFRELKQGEKIFEKDLAQKMRMSRTPVREALLILEQEQLVENRDRLGFIVRRTAPQEIDEYFSIREALERYAAPLIVAHITEAEIAALEASVTEAENYFHSGDTQNFLLCNGAFQELLLNSAHSSLYCRMVANLNDVTTLLRALSLKNETTMTRSLEGHKEIVIAIKNRNVDMLMAALSRHLEVFKTDMTHCLLV